MVALGYLDHDTKRRTYIPNNRVALLGSWVDPHFVRDGPVIGMMKEICGATDHNVVLVTPNRLLVQVAHVIPSRKSGQPYIAVSSAGSILHTATGHALLSLLSDEEIANLVRRYNAECDLAASVNNRALLEKIRRTRSEGYAIQVNESATDGWVMAMPLPVFSDKKLFAVGVGAFANEVTIDPQTVLRITRKAIRNWLGRTERPEHGA
jgi:DNA-binding IclR family transcriptional regulator